MLGVPVAGYLEGWRLAEVVLDEAVAAGLRSAIEEKAVFANLSMEVVEPLRLSVVRWSTSTSTVDFVWPGAGAASNTRAIAWIDRLFHTRRFTTPSHFRIVVSGAATAGLPPLPSRG
jgi:hypothetical protein